MKMLPVRIDLSSRQVMVIGSTHQAFRLVRYLSGFTDSLTLLSASPDRDTREFCSEKNISLLDRAYSREALYGMDVVFLASSSLEVTKDAAAICRTMGISLSVEGCPGKSDFIPEFFFSPVTERSSN